MFAAAFASVSSTTNRTNATTGHWLRRGTRGVGDSVMTRRREHKHAVAETSLRRRTRVAVHLAYGPARNRAGRRSGAPPGRTRAVRRGARLRSHPEADRGHA